MIAATQIESELGGDDHLIAVRGERLADQLLVGERAIHLGGVEEGDAAFNGGLEQRSHLLFVFGRAIREREAHAHAAETEGGDFQITVS